MKALLTALAVLLPLPAYAVCGAHGPVTARLADMYGETRQSVMMDAQGRLVEVYANTATGTWTIILTTPDMMTCLVGAGGNFEATPTTAAPMGDAG